MRLSLRQIACLIVMVWGLLVAAPDDAQAQFLGCDVIQQITKPECETLLSVYESMRGELWINRRGWLATNQPCSWAGVRCTPGTEWPLYISRLNLSSNNVGGFIPVTLVNLTRLRELIIENRSFGEAPEKLTGAIPPDLAEMTSLEVIQLSNNELIGSIPIEFGTLPNLRVLNLDGNRLTGPIPQALGQLENLEELDLSDNDLAGQLPDTLSNMTSLKRLILSDNRFEGPIPPSLGRLVLLNVLHLGDNRLTGPLPDRLADLDSLFWLSVAGNTLSGTMPPRIAGLAPQLASCQAQNNADLCIPDNDLYRQPGRSSICGLPLDSTCNICSDEAGIPTEECEALETLYLRTDGLQWNRQDDWLGSEQPCDWYGVTCTGNRVTSLQLPNNNLTGPLPETLGRLTELQTLDLSRNRLSDALPISIAGLAATLETCTLTDNTGGLCLPEQPEYQALGLTSICGLSLSSSCTPSTVFTGIQDLMAALAGNRARLTWTSDTDSSLLGFDIEQRVNDAFVQIQALEPGNEQSFTYETEPLTPGRHVFRVRTRYSGGSFAYSPEVEVIAELDGAFLSPPYPNPARTTAVARFVLADPQPVQAALYNTLGQQLQLLYSGTPVALEPRTLNLDLTNLPNGLYLIRLTGPDFVSQETVVVLR